MVSSKLLSQGEEVFNTYGEISNEEMLYLYGYAENDEKNPHEEVFIRCQHVYEVCKGMIERQELPLAVAELDARWELLTNRVSQTDTLRADFRGFPFSVPGWMRSFRLSLIGYNFHHSEPFKTRSG